jgi:hypothetical protein
VNTKQAIIATLLVGGLAVWFLGGEDEAVPPAEPPSHQASRQYAPPTQAQPRVPEPRYDYGTARPPEGQGRYSDPRLQPPAPYWGENPYQADAWSDTRGYQFRPLTEQDRRRMAAPEASPYRSMPPPPASPTAPYAPWSDSQHRLRQYAPSEGTAGRYDSPYQGPSWGAEPDYAERWGQWDSVPWHEPEPGPQPYRDPPARRMLPSLDWSSDRTFTAR